MVGEQCEEQGDGLPTTITAVGVTLGMVPPAAVVTLDMVATTFMGMVTVAFARDGIVEIVTQTLAVTISEHSGVLVCVGVS